MSQFGANPSAFQQDPFFNPAQIITQQQRGGLSRAGPGAVVGNRPTGGQTQTASGGGSAGGGGGGGGAAELAKLLGIPLALLSLFPGPLGDIGRAGTSFIQSRPFQGQVALEATDATQDQIEAANAANISEIRDPGLALIDAAGLESTGRINALAGQFGPQSNQFFGGIQGALGQLQGQAQQSGQQLQSLLGDRTAQGANANQSILAGLQDRLGAGLGIINQSGAQERRNINEQFGNLGSQQQLDLRRRGLSGTSLSQDLQRGNLRARSAAQGGLNQRILDQRINTFAGLSGDVLAGQRQNQGILAQLQGDQASSLTQQQGFLGGFGLQGLGAQANAFQTNANNQFGFAGAQNNALNNFAGGRIDFMQQFPNVGPQFNPGQQIAFNAGQGGPI